MQINSQTISNQLKTHDNTPEFRQGEIHRAIVKERSSQNEAILQIRGRDVPVKFEGDLPNNERITVQISGQTDHFVQVRAMATTNKTTGTTTETTSINLAIRNLGVSNPSRELRQAAQMILDKGVPLNRDSIQELRAFVEKEKGTVEQRLHTVQAVANKRLDVTANHLRSVHEALHGRPLNEVLTNIVKEIDPNYNLRREQTSMERPVSEQVREVREQVQRESNVQRAVEQVRNEVVNNPRVDREIARQVGRAVEESRMMHQSGREAVGRTQLVQALQTAEREIVRTEARQVEVRVPESRPAVERPVSEQVREVREQVQRESNVQRSIDQVRNEVVNHPRVNRDLVLQLEKTLNEVQSLNRSGHESIAKNHLVQSLVNIEKVLKNNYQTKETQLRSEGKRESINHVELVNQMKATIQKEGDFQKLIAKLQNGIEKASIEQPIKKQIINSLEDATKLNEQGRELAARQQLMQTFTTVEQQVANTDQAIQLEAQQYTMNDNFQSQQLSSKNMIVQTITEKLAQAQADFKSLQREIARNLDNIQRLTEAFKSQAIKQVKPLLETTIKKLDNAILKSEMMLLTDMKTEKRLMQASSQLAEAKKLLTKGNYQEANKIVQEVKTLVEKLEFKPSETKVKHFITREEQNIQNRTPSQQLIQQFDEMTRRTAATQDFSARQAFELVRGLGLNRDSEVAQMLASGRQGDAEPNQNMKTALMQLMKIEEEQGRVSQQTNQALANITGQQLLSKSDSNSNLQSMFFSLPFLLEDDVKNLQVFVNSRNEGQQVDWENCNLYFLIETRKLGEVGILVTSTDRNLSLTIKNDQPFFKERIEPLAELCKANLKDVGYNITSINFTKLNATASSNIVQEKGRDEQENLTPTFTEKGFDFKI
ncbi:hypothetical protein BKP37_04425 [Anaerobacillus alkalilacustris]|uniref:Flagellar hook-length control protein-like C-terminal domain-containing protein n=1 Tax=Anaerobacillus alkalilacustris TaxID=393763 RepID=A0A1S2LWK9_9BACI|nr:hypothetical protein [Anaerobacillus alkalilacustris]OIJ16909.1 hypothetical protein BKP37_04425 [Anaerobacillus alkalilacustris]